MSMLDEVLISRLIDDMLFCLYQEDACTKGMWITNDGEYISIRDMATNHILNAMNMLNRNREGYGYFERDLADRYIELFKAELSRRYPLEDPAFMNG